VRIQAECTQRSASEEWKISLKPTEAGIFSPTMVIVATAIMGRTGGSGVWYVLQLNLIAGMSM
jgi:hypothetical protein